MSCYLLLSLRVYKIILPPSSLTNTILSFSVLSNFGWLFRRPTQAPFWPISGEHIANHFSQSLEYTEFPFSSTRNKGLSIQKMKATRMSLSKQVNFEKMHVTEKNLKNWKCCSTVLRLIYLLWVLHNFSRIKANRSISGLKLPLWDWHASSSG